MKKRNYNSKLSKILTKKFLIKEYIINKKSTYQIGKENNCTYASINNYLRKYNIKIRNLSESHKDITKGKKNGFYGKHHTKETKEKIRTSDYHSNLNDENNPMFNVRIRQENHYNWQGGKTGLGQSIKTLTEYILWRKTVLKKDFYTCQECGQIGYQLEVHHIRPFAELLAEFLKEYDQFSPIDDKETLIRLAIKWKSFWNIDNGIALCEECHKTEHSNLKII